MVLDYIWFKSPFETKFKVNNIITTRKSSCVNARGIPTMAYQVLHLLPQVGYTLAGVPLARSDGGGYLRWGTPQQANPPARSDGSTQGGPPAWTWLGYPHLDLAGVPPCLDLAGIPPAWIWLGYPPSWTWLGYPPFPCGQTDGWTDTCENNTFPSYYVRGR